MILPWVIFWSVLAILAYTDYVAHKIPLIIIIPAIIAGLWFNKEILAVSLMFLTGIILYELKFWQGGDMKLFMFVASFLGFSAFIIFLMTFGCIYLYRFAKKIQDKLPVTPFVLSGTVLFFLFNGVIPNTVFKFLSATTGIR